MKKTYLKPLYYTFLFLIVTLVTFAYTNKETPTSPSPNPKPPIKKAKNIIFFIGDGMGLSQITAACFANGNYLNLERFPVVGLIKTPSSNNIITDSAAGATAFSTGKKTNNGAIGVDKSGKPLKTIIELAEQKNISTGIVVTCTVTHATPAAFYGHQPTRSNVNEQLAYTFIKSGIDVLVGGGKKYFMDRTDKLNLLDSLRNKGYTVIDSIAQASGMHTGQLVCLVTPEQPAGLLGGTRDSYLPQATAKAIELLKNNENGFFLMVEGSQIDWGGHENNTEYIIKETIEFDNAIAEALKFAQQDSNTLIIVTADHETGGFSITGGNLTNKTVQGAFTTDYHTATMIPVFAYGAGSQEFAGIYDNTEIYSKFLKVWGIEEENK